MRDPAQRSAPRVPDPAPAARLRALCSFRFLWDLGEAGFWRLHAAVRRKACRGDADALRTQLDAEYRWRLFRAGFIDYLSFPHRRGRPSPLDSRAVRMFAAWLAGLVAIPGIGRIERALATWEIAAVGALALDGRWGGTAAWSAIDDESKVRGVLSDLRRQGDIAIVSRPTDVCLASGFPNPPPCYAVGPRAAEAGGCATRSVSARRRRGSVRRLEGLGMGRGRVRAWVRARGPQDVAPVWARRATDIPPGWSTSTRPGRLRRGRCRRTGPPAGRTGRTRRPGRGTAAAGRRRSPSGRRSRRP